ncbi:MAG TPA: phospholipase [Thermoflexia bacterium]|nr:phospholipase [Thermoflexia bacterium]
MKGLKDVREAVERILEDESLTADLADAAARRLLEWATEEAERIVRETEGSPRERQVRLRALRQSVRRIAKEAKGSSPADQLGRVQALLELGTLAAQVEERAEDSDRRSLLRPGGLLFLSLVVLALVLQQCVGGGWLGQRAARETVAAGWVTVYFTDPRSPGDDPSTYTGGIDEDLVALIDAAQERVDVAAYDLDLERVTDALIRAQERGVQVRLVTDGGNVDEEPVTRLRQAGIPVVARPEEDRGLMHDKFVVVDGTWVWTGSWNLTENGTYRNDNNALLIASELLARDYATEFDELFSGLFGPSSPADTPYPVIEVEAGSEVARIEVYFAPEDGATEGILNVLSQARSHVRFLAYHFTNEHLADALIDLARRGIRVEGVIEARTAQDAYSQFDRLRASGVEVLPDGNPYIMHHKVFIVDDQTVVTGSFNFTLSAEERNDENVLILHDTGIAAAYIEEFDRVMEVARSGGQ